MKKLYFEQIKKLVHGVAHIEEGDGNISFYRFTKEQQELYRSVSPNDFYIKTFATSGVSLEFETDSEDMTLEVEVSRGSSRTFFTHSIFIDGEKFSDLSGDIKDKENVYFEKTFSLPRGMKKVKILFPWSVQSKLVALKLDESAKIVPIEKNFKLLTASGEAEVTFLNEDGSRLRVSMGKLSFWSDDIPVTGERREVINEDMVFGRTLYPVTCATIGNPHCIIPMREISKHLVCKIGEYAEMARYFPNRVNTQIMKVMDKENVAIEIYERGAGYTLASGTGACAAAGVVAAAVVPDVLPPPLNAEEEKE